jgi:hypothetical protein
MCCSCILTILVHFKSMLMVIMLHLSTFYRKVIGRVCVSSPLLTLKINCRPYTMKLQAYTDFLALWIISMIKTICFIARDLNSMNIKSFFSICHWPITIPCYAILYYTMLCYAMLCYAIPCYAMLCYIMLRYAMPYHTIPYYTTRSYWQRRLESTDNRFGKNVFLQIYLQKENSVL